MGLRAAYLADKSALARMTKDAVASRLAPLLLEGKVATCPMIDLELGFSARSSADYEGLRTERAGLESAPMGEEAFDRALEVQRELARREHHRGASLPDLLIAATAERAHLVVLHYDSDFDRIAAITGQSVEWVVPRGTVD